MDAIIYERATDLLEAELGAELVALDEPRGECFGFNEVATSVWRLLDRPRSLVGLKDGLLDEYDVDADECERDLRELIGKLCDMALIRRRHVDV